MADASTWLVILLFAAGLFLLARQVRASRNQSGGPVPGSPEAENNDRPSLRVATFNIQGGKNLAGERDIRRAASVLADTDLAGVQEIYAANWPNRLGSGASQTDSLTMDSGASGIFCATRRRWFREDRGNAVLSKLPIKSWQKTMLPTHTGKSYRNMTTVQVLWQGEQFHFINTHLHTREGRDQQLAIVLAEFNRYQRAILVGDFNCSTDSPLIAELLQQKDLVDAIAEAELDRPGERRIDWIICKGFRVLEGKRIERGISDHPGFIVSLAFS